MLVVYLRRIQRKKIRLNEYSNSLCVSFLVNIENII